MVLKMSTMAMFLTYVSLVPLCFALKPNYTVADMELLFQEFWKWKLVNNPEFATRIGISKYDNRVNELSISAFRRRAEEVGLFLEKLEDIKKSIDLKGKDTLALNVDLLESDLKQFLNGMQFNTYVWPLSIMEGPQSDPAFLLNLMEKNTAADMNNIITRIRLIAHQVHEEIDLLNEGIRIGQTMNRNAFEKLIPVLLKISSAKVDDHPFFGPFKTQPKNISTSKWNDIVTSARKAITTYIKPVYKKIHDFMKTTYLPKSRPLVGLSSVPNGAAYYQALLQYHTTSPHLTPHKVHSIGLQEVARINKLMDTVRQSVKFNGTLLQFRQYLRTSDKFGFKDEKDMLNHYKSIRAKVEKMLPRYFGVLPKIPFVIKPVPADLAPSSPMAYYMEASPDGRPGTFFINTYLPQKRRKFIAESLFLHEAVPGHHLQIALKIEHGSPVLFRRFAGMDVPYYQAPASFSMNTAFTEGWGLYAEYLGEEMSMYKDPYVYFGRLSQEMLRACRLVVDTGMHALGWTRQMAIDFMGMYTADDKHDITSEIDRYISIPGQACAYKIGEIKLRELRKMATDKLGSKFDIRKFHDFLMVMGNIPLAQLEKQVLLFIHKELQL